MGSRKLPFRIRNAIAEPLDEDRDRRKLVSFVFHRLLPEQKAARRGPFDRLRRRKRDAAAAFSSARSWLPREVFPSMATRSGRSGQVSRTHLENAAENSAGLIRFMSRVSQRLPGTP